MLTWLTPTLAVGEWVETLTADEATNWIQDGNFAVVADFATASEVLTNLGLTDDEIIDRLHFARTGEVLSG